MIGAGIFTTSGLLMANLGNPVLMVGLWFLGGVLALCGAMSYSELGANYPKAGGEYAFLTELYSPLFGFLSGWVSFIVGFSAPIAASSLGFSEYIFRIFPEDGPLANITILKKGLAIFIILIFTLIHIYGLRSGSMVQNLLTVFKITLIVFLLAIGFGWGNGNFDHFITNDKQVVGFGSLKSIGLSLMWIMFAYSGWNASTYVGSEIKRPEKNIPKSLILGTVCVTALYLGLNVLFVFALPVHAMEGVISIGGLTVNHLFNESLDQYFSLFIAIMLLSSISAFIIIGPRVYYAMAKDRHFFKLATYVNKQQVPSKSIALQSLLAIIFVLTGTFDQILTFLGFALGIFPLLAVFGVIKLRWQNRSRFKLSGYPFVQIIFIVLSLSILIFAYMERPLESSIAIAVVLLGIPVFYFRKGKRKN